MSDKPEDQGDEQEIARRRDEVLKRLMQMPPKPHEEMKLERRKAHRQEHGFRGREDEDGPHEEGRPG